MLDIVPGIYRLIGCPGRTSEAILVSSGIGTGWWLLAGVEIDLHVRTEDAGSVLTAIVYRIG